MNILILYRYQSKALDDKRTYYLLSFQKLFSNFIDNSGIRYKAFLITDNTPQYIEKDLAAKASQIFEHISVQSIEQKECLISGKPCTPKHYTLYITSMDLVKNYADEDSIIFFCEDDYLYRPDAFEKAVVFMMNHSNDFLTLYDHPNRYDEKAPHFQRIKELNNYEPYKLELLWEAKHHWRTCVSTCHSFVATLRSLTLNKRLFIDCDKQRGDHTLWTEMWRQGKSKLWGAIPGLTSHRHGPHLDDWEWEALFQKG